MSLNYIDKCNKLGDYLRESPFLRRIGDYVGGEGLFRRIGEYVAREGLFRRRFFLWRRGII